MSSFWGEIPLYLDLNLLFYPFPCSRTTEDLNKIRVGVVPLGVHVGTEDRDLRGTMEVVGTVMGVMRHRDSRTTLGTMEEEVVDINNKEEEVMVGYLRHRSCHYAFSSSPYALYLATMPSVLPPMPYILPLCLQVTLYLITMFSVLPPMPVSCPLCFWWLASTPVAPMPSMNSGENPSVTSKC